MLLAKVLIKKSKEIIDNCTVNCNLVFCCVQLDEKTVTRGKFRISKNWDTSLWDFVPNSGLRKFRHGKSIALSTKLVVVDGRACWQHLYDSRRVVAVYYKSVNCNPLTPLLRFVVDFFYNLLLQLTDSALLTIVRVYKLYLLTYKISTDTARRAVRLR